MSLINDALKRANQAPPPSTAQQTTTGMRAVEFRHRSFPWVIFICVLIPVFVLAAWFLVKGWQLSRAAQASENEVVAHARTSDARSSTLGRASPRAADAPRPLVKAGSPSSVKASNLQTNSAFGASTTRNSITQAPASMEPPKPVFPTLKLQGVFWRPSRPSAVINSKTVYKGDRVDNALVLAIDPESVTVQLEGETKVLTLQ